MSILWQSSKKGVAMLDQNVTTILSTLIGGILTILGGVIASYLLQTKTDGSERRKELRMLIEELSDMSYRTQVLYNKILDKLISISEKKSTSNEKNTDIDEVYFEIDRITAKMSLMISAYLPSLTPATSEFISGIRKVAGMIYNALDNDTTLKNEASKKQLRDDISILLIETDQKFRNSLIAMLQKKGYSCFCS